jgi:hypothetical protein
VVQTELLVALRVILVVQPESVVLLTPTVATMPRVLIGRVALLVAYAVPPLSAFAVAVAAQLVKVAFVVRVAFANNVSSCRGPTRDREQSRCGKAEYVKL